MDLPTLEEFIEQALYILNDYGFLLVIFFGIIHPLLEGPFALINLSLAFYLLGYPLGYLTVFLSNMIGVIILIILLQKFNKISNYYLQKKKITNDAFEWIKSTPRWKHMYVIGVPIIPTYPIKISVPLSGLSFTYSFITLMGSYIVLFIGNSLIYFGILEFMESGISRVLSFIFLLTTVILVYFGNQIFTKKSPNISQE